MGTRNDYQRAENSGHNRAINRHQWDYDSLKSELEDSSSHHHQVYNHLKSLLKVRCSQTAFHPNATQFTLHLGSQLFGFWRQSMDRVQSIFCVSNISDQTQLLDLSDLNLIDTENWYDLISGNQFDEANHLINLAPYQTVWITNQ